MSESGDTTLSLFGDVCSDGSLTAILALMVTGVLFLIRLFLHRALDKKKPKQEGIVKGKHWLEDLLITPFIPSSLESYIAVIYFAWFVMTIPMAITRYYEKRWANQVLSQQGPLNILANAMGCEGLHIDAINYTYPIPCPAPEGRKKGAEGAVCDADYSDEVDHYFSLHLAFGITWLSVGALQIFWARTGWSHDPEIRRKAHRIFGYVAVASFCCHITMACRIAYRNPVNQIWVITAQYWAAIFESILLVFLGLRYRWTTKNSPDPKVRSKGEAMHMVRMFFAYVQSIFGSGAVRLTAWILWLVGKFFKYETRLIIDRGVCQTDAIPMGSAEHCWKAVFFNLATTDALLLWMEWIFLCIPRVARFDTGDKKSVISKFKQLGLLLATFTVLVAVGAPDAPIQWLVALWAGVVKMQAIRMYIVTFRKDVRGPVPANASTLEKASRFVKTSLLTAYAIPYDDSDSDDDDDHQD